MTGLRRRNKLIIDDIAGIVLSGVSKHSIVLIKGPCKGFQL